MTTAGPHRSPQHAIPLALVHHANQYLITTRYGDRQGLPEIADGYDALLDAHERYGVPLGLHLSGTLIEALAWFRPQFLARVRALADRGLVSLIGGTYSENIMPLFSDEHNRRQLRELLDLHRIHLGGPRRQLKLCWVPERAWDPRLAPLLTDRALANGGYDAVLLDDRLLFDPDAAAPELSRDAFDEAQRVGGHTGAYHGRSGASTGGVTSDGFRICEVEGAAGLRLVPISSRLRYAIPPRAGDDLGEITRLAAALRDDADPRTIMVYADDAEKAAGVGGWDDRALGEYQRFLAGLSAQDGVEAVDLAAWLAGRRELPARPVKQGTFFELSQAWGAGEDYRGWWHDPRWRTARQSLQDSEAAVRAAGERGADGRLLDLAWKHLLASAYETAWQDDVGPERRPAAWALALASHARSARVLAAAARWCHAPPDAPLVQLTDIDGDGETEAVVCNDRIFAVLAPSRGGRLMYLAERASDGGRLILGNPSDDWNLQEELNRFMDDPSNHPGGLADVGFEHDRYTAYPWADQRGAGVTMENVEPGSALYGAVKTVSLRPASGCVDVCYAGVAPPNLATHVCLSPDYLALLREGRLGLRPLERADCRGWERGGASAWVAIDPGEATRWADADLPEVGHGLTERLLAGASHFHLAVGAGPLPSLEDARWCARTQEPAAELARDAALSVVAGS